MDVHKKQSTSIAKRTFLKPGDIFPIHITTTPLNSTILIFQGMMAGRVKHQIYVVSL